MNGLSYLITCNDCGRRTRIIYEPDKDREIVKMMDLEPPTACPICANGIDNEVVKE